MKKGYKYLVIGRCIDGVNVIGYMLRDWDTTESKLVDRKDVERLALNKLISNMTAQLYNGRVLLKGLNCKISSLPNYDKQGNLIDGQVKIYKSSEELVLKSRILSGKSISGYELALCCNGVVVESTNLSRNKVIQLAKEGHVANARVQMSNGVPVLRGVKCDLAQLPAIRQ